MSKERIYRWRWLRGEGLEVMRLERPGDHIRARGEVIDAGAEPHALTYDWELDFTWRTRRLHLQVRGDATRELVIERYGRAFSPQTLIHGHPPLRLVDHKDRANSDCL
ncbi:MAG: putative glycolipid-binding domain-containing protein [Alphaproteobacteria bacterium]|nr:putative glycolipid-binding domain-containing protein [Alphaproteobacteria bacterium]